MAGERPSSDLGQALSQVLHRLTGQESRRGHGRSAALQDLGALLEAPGCDRFWEGGDPAPGGAPGMLGKVAAALEKHAAPRKEEEGGAGGDPTVAERAAAVALLFTKLLRKVASAREPPVCPRHLAAPVYVFAVAHSSQQPWTRPASRDAAREVLALLLRVTECGSVAGFLRGEKEDEKGRFAEVMGLLQPDLNK